MINKAFGGILILYSSIIRFEETPKFTCYSSLDKYLPSAYLTQDDRSMICKLFIVNIFIGYKSHKITTVHANIYLLLENQITTQKIQ